MSVRGPANRTKIIPGALYEFKSQEDFEGWVSILLSSFILYLDLEHTWSIPLYAWISLTYFCVSLCVSLWSWMLSQTDSVWLRFTLQAFSRYKPWEAIDIIPRFTQKSKKTGSKDICRYEPKIVFILSITVKILLMFKIQAPGYHAFCLSVVWKKFNYLKLFFLYIIKLAIVLCVVHCSILCFEVSHS